MTSTTATPVAAAETPVPLDQLMLAMDVVDTLRHQQDLVDAELDEDRRQRDLVARVRSLYAAQGIEVSAEVVAEGVKALREDRFTYQPPPRTLAVRLAEIYVERGKWALRLALAALLVLAVYAAFALPAHFRRRGQIDGFARQLAATAQQAVDLLQRADVLAAQLQRARSEGDAATTAQLLDQAAAALQAARDQAAGVHAELVPLPDAEQYPARQSDCDLRLHSQEQRLDQANAGLGAATGLLAGVQQLRSLKARFAASQERLRDVRLSPAERADIDKLGADVQAAIDRTDHAAGDQAMRAFDQYIDGVQQRRQQLAVQRMALERLRGALDGVAVEPAAATELDELRTAAAQALDAGDLDRAVDQLGQLRALVQQLDQGYELRIVSGPNERSGVWRESVDHPGTRNYYIIVEAIGRDGRALQQRITSEEDQSTRNVRRFGVRVPERVYEAVKADKLDNGLIDDKVFGEKRRGERAVRYRREVAGGMITEW